MGNFKYILFAAFVYTAVTQGPMAWKRFQLQRMIAKTGGAKTFALPQNCKNKKYCLTVYVSPMAANQSTDITLLAFQKFLPRLRPEMGFGLVIGNASSGDLVQMKDHLHLIESHLDDTGFIMKAREIKTYPTWIVTNPDGDEISRLTQVGSAADLGGVNQILVDYFKL